MGRTKLSLTFSYIQTFNFTKIDLMVGLVIIIIITIVMLVNSTTVPILTPIRITSLILGIKFSTRCYLLLIRVIPTFIGGMGLATNLAFYNGLLILIGLYLRLGLTYSFTLGCPLAIHKGTSPFASANKSASCANSPRTLNGLGLRYK